MVAKSIPALLWPEKRRRVRVVDLSQGSDKDRLVSEEILPTLSSQFDYCDHVTAESIAFDDVGWVILVLNGKEPTAQWMAELKERGDSIHIIAVLGKDSSPETSGPVKDSVTWDNPPDIIIVHDDEHWQLARSGFSRALETAMVDYQRRSEDTQQVAA